jgi:hypothetical protein
MRTRHVLAAKATLRTRCSSHLSLALSSLRVVQSNEGPLCMQLGGTDQAALDTAKQWCDSLLSHVRADYEVHRARHAADAQHHQQSGAAYQHSDVQRSEKRPLMPPNHHTPQHQSPVGQASPMHVYRSTSGEDSQERAAKRVRTEEGQHQQPHAPTIAPEDVYDPFAAGNSDSD